MIRLENVTFSSKAGYLFKDVNFSISPGQLMLVKGVNGSGKSTLLQIIAALEECQGQIYFNNILIKNLIDEYRGNINFIFHQNILDLENTVMSNINFWGKIMGSTKEEVNIAIKYFGLSKVLDFKISELSSGWQRKVELTKLLLKNKKIWILDEPETSLDKASVQKLINLIEVRLKSNGLVIMASHNFNDFPNANILELRGS
jgi:heme exporter protein A